MISKEIFIFIIILFICCQGIPECPQAQIVDEQTKEPRDFKIAKFLTYCNGKFLKSFAISNKPKAEKAKLKKELAEGWLECIPRKDVKEEECPVVWFENTVSEQSVKFTMKHKKVDKLVVCRADISIHCANHHEDESKAPADIVDLAWFFIASPPPFPFTAEIHYPKSKIFGKFDSSQLKDKVEHFMHVKEDSIATGDDMKWLLKRDSTQIKLGHSHMDNPALEVAKVTDKIKKKIPDYPSHILKRMVSSKIKDVPVTKAKADYINYNDDIYDDGYDVDKDYYDYGGYDGGYDDGYNAQYIIGYRAGYMAAMKQQMKSLYKIHKKKRNRYYK